MYDFRRRGQRVVDDGVIIAARGDPVLEAHVEFSAAHVCAAVSLRHEDGVVAEERARGELRPRLAVFAEVKVLRARVCEDARVSLEGLCVEAAGRGRRQRGEDAAARVLIDEREGVEVGHAVLGVAPEIRLVPGIDLKIVVVVVKGGLEGRWRRGGGETNSHDAADPRAQLTPSS